MQIDYICLPRVFLEDLAGAFGLPRSQEFGLLADLNVGESLKAAALLWIGGPR